MPPPPNQRPNRPAGVPAVPDFSKDLDHDGNIDAGDDRINDLNHDGRIDAEDDPTLDLNHDGRIDGDDAASHDLDHDHDIDADDEALEAQGQEAAQKPDSVGASLGWSKSSGNWNRPDSPKQNISGPKQGLG